MMSCHVRITNNDVMNVIGRWDRESANNDVMSCEEGGVKRLTKFPVSSIGICS